MTQISKFKHRLWMLLGCYSMALPIFKFYGVLAGGGIGVVSSSTDIVIEGYPRSANTFALSAFLLAQQQQVEIAHHIHGPAQIIWAVRHSIPTLVLIREPRESVVSLVVRQPLLSLQQALKNYIRFYEKVFPYRGSFVVADFDEVTSDYGSTIERVNWQFGTSFMKFEHTDENVQRCYQLIEEMDRRDTGRRDTTVITVARPSSQREVMKDNLREKFEEDNLQSLVTRADEIYYAMISTIEEEGYVN